jgi:lysyl-tRNA synthetase class I
MRFRLRRPEQPVPELAPAEERALGALYAELAHLGGHDGASLANRIYTIAEQEGLESRALFKAAYHVLLDAERGPRLADFILLSGRERIAPLLAPYADRTPAAAAAAGAPGGGS